MLLLAFEWCQPAGQASMLTFSPIRRSFCCRVDCLQLSGLDQHDMKCFCSKTWYTNWSRNWTHDPVIVSARLYNHSAMCLPIDITDTVRQNRGDAKVFSIGMSWVCCSPDFVWNCLSIFTWLFTYLFSCLFVGICWRCEEVSPCSVALWTSEGKAKQNVVLSPLHLQSCCPIPSSDDILK